MQAVKIIGLDIAKSVFQVQDVDADGQVVVRRKLKRRIRAATQRAFRFSSSHWAPSRLALKQVVPNLKRVTTTVDGGLISYGPNGTDMFRRTAGYVDCILKGEKPANPPVQAPTKYALTINLKAAKALGLTVPFGLLNAADEVIE